MASNKTYNQRLFSGWMGLYHNRRFEWIKANLDRISYESVLEMGCYDGRLLKYISPKYYCGLDKGTDPDTGIAVAFKQYKGRPDVCLIQGDKPENLPDRAFDIFVSLETFEHIDPDLVEPYLEAISKIVNKRAFFSVPVERGLPLIIASLSRLINRVPGAEIYTAMEFINAVFGRMHKVKRSSHKGFDDRVLVNQIQKYFRVEKIESMFGPKWLGLHLGLGITAVPRNVREAEPVASSGNTASDRD